MNKDAKSCVLVLGMHRSGSSLMAGLLAKRGLCSGAESDLLPPKEDNIKGFWEYKPLVDFHDRLMLDIGYSWLNPPPPDFDFSAMANYSTYLQEASGLLANMDELPSTWFWKDPRMGCLLNFWQPLLERRKLAVIVTVRHPAEIACSLLLRDGLPRPASALVWQRTMLAIAEWLRPGSLPVLFVDFKKLLTESEDEIARIDAFVTVATGRKSGAREISAMRELIEPDLPASHKAKDTSFLTLEQIELHDWLSSLCDLDEGAVSSLELPTRFVFENNFATLYLDSLRQIIENREKIKQFESRLNLLAGQICSHQEEFNKLHVTLEDVRSKSIRGYIGKIFKLLKIK